LIAMTITSLVSIVLGGLILAVHTAREHTDGLGDATLQGQGAIERIKLTVADAGVYRVSGQPTVMGLAVVRQTWSSYSMPSILAVWNGGQSGGMAAAGVQTRLPKVNELTIYAPDPAAPARLLEITLPARTDSIDFAGATFTATVLSLIADSGARKVALCDRLRTSPLTTGGGTPSTAGNVWFELDQLPSATSLAAATPGTSAWNALVWSQGIVGSDFGMRQATLRIELQLALRSTAVQGDALTMPFFGSASYRYVYQK
jgi:hypothetical protein